jgi:hypothetical protein
MKKIFLLLILMVALSVSVFAQRKDKSPVPDALIASTVYTSYETFKQQRANIIGTFSNWYVESYRDTEYIGDNLTQAISTWGCIYLMDSYDWKTKVYILVRYKTDIQLKDLLQTDIPMEDDLIWSYQIPQ